MIRNRNVKIYYNTGTTAIDHIPLAPNRSYIVFACTSYETGSNISYVDSKGQNVISTYIYFSGTCKNNYRMSRTRTIGDSGGGVLNMAAIVETGTNASVSTEVYGYYNDPRGYQEVEAELIAVPYA